MASQERVQHYSTALLKHLSRGRLDEYLDTIIDTAMARRRYLNEQKAIRNKAMMIPGTRVKISGNIKPKYLWGLTGTVTDAEFPRPRSNKDFVAMRLDRGVVGRYGPTVFCPPALLSRLKDQTPHPGHGYENQDQEAQEAEATADA